MFFVYWAGQSWAMGQGEEETRGGLGSGIRKNQKDRREVRLRKDPASWVSALYAPALACTASTHLQEVTRLEGSCWGQEVSSTPCVCSNLGLFVLWQQLHWDNTVRKQGFLSWAW